MNGLFSKFSLYVLILSCAFISIFRLSHLSEKEITWDILGYYMPLPAAFIYDDPLLEDTAWLEKINEEKHLTGTLYQVSSTPKGKPMYFFLFGMAFFYLPFFLSGHAYASASGYPADGFSEPYQYALVIGAILYAIIGLLFLRKVLRHFFSEMISGLVMLVIVFGTNYCHHLTIKNLEPVNILFMLVCILIWNTIRWHESKQNKHFIGIVICITLVGLVKPSEVLIVLLPLLWGVGSRQELFEKIKTLLQNRKVLIIAFSAALLLALPQLIYWQVKTGFFIYDSYKNPGIGLDIFSPHILDILFSYRKGWLVYTPVMILALAGFYFLYQYNRRLFGGIFISFFVSFYIIASWSEWWYGAGFSCRPLITTYPLLAICMGYFFVFMSGLRWPIRILTGVFISFCIFLNQFQWWQLNNYILDPYRTTKAYYWAIFLKTGVSEEQRKLLLFERKFTDPVVFEDRENYRSRMLHVTNFNGHEERLSIIGDSTNSSFYRVFPKRRFSLVRKFPFREITSKDHIWIRARIMVRIPETYTGPLPHFVLHMDHNGNYGYAAHELSVSQRDQWQEFEFYYLSPEIRDKDDILKMYIWKTGTGTIDVDNLRLEVFEPIN